MNIQTINQGFKKVNHIKSPLKIYTDLSQLSAIN
jgi:hypothetical protein